MYLACSLAVTIVVHEVRLQLLRISAQDAPGLSISFVFIPYDSAVAWRAQRCSPIRNLFCCISNPSVRYPLFPE